MPIKNEDGTLSQYVATENYLEDYGTTTQEVVPMLLSRMGDYDDDIPLNIVPKKKWELLKSNKKLSSLTLPVPYVIILCTASSECTDQKSCNDIARNIQSYHVNKNKWDDIGYNFLVGGDGVVYEGRGWNATGAHTAKYNTKSIGISFIGTFKSSVPSDNQIMAGKNLIKKGIEIGAISKDYKLIGARQVSANEAPGDAFFEDLKKWDHWAAKP